DHVVSHEPRAKITRRTLAKKTRDMQGSDGITQLQPHVKPLDGVMRASQNVPRRRRLCVRVLHLNYVAETNDAHPLRKPKSLLGESNRLGARADVHLTQVGKPSEHLEPTRCFPR